MNHPVRRRIVMFLMLVGNAGFVTAAGTLLLSFTGGVNTRTGLTRVGILVGGLVVVWILSRSELVSRLLSRLIERILRRATHVARSDHASLLRLSQEWVVAELEVRDGDWMAGRTLAELDLPHEGALILGIEPASGGYIGAPKGSTFVRPGDVVLVYGKERTIESLDERPAGDRGDRDRSESAERYRVELMNQDALERPSAVDPTIADRDRRQ